MADVGNVGDGETTAGLAATGLGGLLSYSLPELVVSTLGTAHPPSMLLWILLGITTLQATLNTAVTASVLAPRSAYLADTPPYFVLVTGARLDVHYDPNAQLVLFIIAAAWTLGMLVFLASLLRHRGAA